MGSGPAWLSRSITQSLPTIWRRECRAGAIGRSGFLPLAVKDVTTTRPEPPLAAAPFRTIKFALTNERLKTVPVFTGTLASGGTNCRALHVMITFGVGTKVWIAAAEMWCGMDDMVLAVQLGRESIPTKVSAGRCPSASPQMINTSLINPPDHRRRHVVFCWCRQDDQSEGLHLLRHPIRCGLRLLLTPLNFPGTCAARDAVEPHGSDDRIAQNISRAKPRRHALDMTAFETGPSRLQLSNQDPPGRSRITPRPLRPRASLAVRDHVIRHWAQHRSRASAERCPVRDRDPLLGAHAL